MDLFAAWNNRMLVLWQALKEGKAAANSKVSCMWMPGTSEKDSRASGIIAQLKQESLMNTAADSHKQLLLKFFSFGFFFPF